MKTIRFALFPKLVLLALAVFFSFTSCGQTVKRIDPNSVIDLSGNWNDTDSRLVAEEMLNDCLTRPWYQNTLKAKGGAIPVIVIGQIRNLSSEHINTNTFISDIQRVLINSGKVAFVANSEERRQFRQEIDDQAGNATDETAKERGQETGADIMLTGTVNLIIDQSGGQAVKLYKVNLELTDIQSHRKLWIDDKEIKKFIDKNSLKL
jgi:uncharacterized protein (TIGR02722 family)